jgi:hypothetical protein
MTHTHCTRINLRDGSKSFVEFGEVDGKAFHAKWHNGFYTKVALLIVNRWNYIAALQRIGRIEYHYYLHTAEGAE